MALKELTRYIPIIREAHLLARIGNRINLGELFLFVLSPYIFISFPKSGRTWVRFFIDAYYTEKYKHRGKTIKDMFSLRIDRRGRPRIISKHFTNGMATTDELHAWFTDIFRTLRHKKALFLFRDPRDVLVSFYFQLRKRDGVIGADTTANAFVYNEQYGIRSIVRYMNACLAHKDQFRSTKTLLYRDLKSDPSKCFREVLNFFGEEEIDEKAFAHALAESDFSSMQKVETAQKTGGDLPSSSPKIRAGDKGNADDPESYKVRRGKVGGYTDYLTGSARLFVDRVVAKELDPHFGFISEN